MQTTAGRNASPSSYCTASNARLKSAMMSSICSVPIESRIVFGKIPCSESSCAFSSECVVVAGISLAFYFIVLSIAVSRAQFLLHFKQRLTKQSPRLEKTTPFC